MTILDQLAAYARERTKQAKENMPLAELKERALALPKGNFAFEKTLQKQGISFICECKKASPSKGLIAPEFPYVQIAKEYQEAGADCISVLTEPKWFLGRDEYLKEIAEAVTIPCLRKDFTVDIENSCRLRKLVPKEILFVSESGMKTRQDIMRLEENGTDAVLIGESLMRCADKRAMLQELKG